ncbi:MAG: ankyrin repeat domain-containing protein [Gammaproteobacteria bacterium]|nr:ankyrin repeat domain-containing protein [Gammaproteobacteria bacterium]
MRLHSYLALLLCVALPLPAAANMANVVVSPADHELLMAVGQGQMARVETLLQMGANVNTRHPPWQLTPLLVASEMNSAMVKLLLGHSAEVNVSDREGMTPLMKAVDLRDLSMVALLLDAGARVNTQDQRGHTALSHAVLRSDAAILKLLIKRGADVDVVAALGTTPWSIAQRMHAAALAMHDDLDAEAHAHMHMHMPGHASHPMRNKQESLAQTQAVLDILATTGVQRPQQPVKFDALELHGH